MRISNLLVCAGAVVLVGACGGSRSSTTLAFQHSCQSPTDLVQPNVMPLITALAPGTTLPATVAKTVQLKCGSILTIAQNGAATVDFGNLAGHSFPAAFCQLSRDNLQIAKLLSRDPASAFFSLESGKALCTIGTPYRHVMMCGTGVLLLTGTQFEGVCNPDPELQVSVHVGQVLVSDPSGPIRVPSGQKLTLNLRTGKFFYSAAEFSAADLALFSRQAAELGLSITHGPPMPQTINFTSTAPANVAPGDTYPVSATGGSSGNPVHFSVDPASASVCSMAASSIVMFDNPGTCTIDANQGGNAQYLAAPQAQQSVLVGQSMIAQTITFTSSVPATAYPGSLYSVSADGGNSGNTVIFSIDTASISVCSISNTNVVTFNNPGTCTIDANQAGNAQYLAAPQAQQSVTVQQSPPLQ